MSALLAFGFDRHLRGAGSSQTETAPLPSLAIHFLDWGRRTWVNLKGIKQSWKIGGRLSVRIHRPEPGEYHSTTLSGVICDELFRN